MSPLARIAFISDAKAKPLPVSHKERFYSRAVADERELFFGVVPNRKREHPVELFETVDAPAVETP